MDSSVFTLQAGPFLILGVSGYLLTHLSHSDKVSFCDHILSVMLACICASVRVCIRIYARYIGRLAFVLASGLFRHCGVKNCVVVLTNR